MFESAYPPVAGDFDPKWVLPLAGRKWPDKGPVAIIKRLFFPKGSVSGGQIYS